MMEYQVVVEYDPETKHYMGTVIGIPNIIVDAKSERSVIRMAREAIVLYLEETAKRRPRAAARRRASTRSKIVTVDV